MSKITYQNKVGIEPKTVAINQWQDVDANQVKEVVNNNDTCLVSVSFPAIFDKTSSGRRYGSFASPLTGAITLSTSGAQEGGCVVVVWSGASNPLIIGGVVQNISGTITDDGIYSIYFHYLNGRFNVLIFNPQGETPPVVIPDPPTALQVDSISDTSIDLTWTKSVTGVMDSYRVYIEGLFYQSFAGDVALGTVTGLSPSTTYNNITVRAFDGLVESADSNSVNATTTNSGVTETSPTITVTTPTAETSPIITVT